MLFVYILKLDEERINTNSIFIENFIQIWGRFKPSVLVCSVRLLLSTTQVKFSIMWLSYIWLCASTHHISLSSAGVLQRIWRILHKISAYNKAMLMKRQLFISLIYYSFFLINVIARYFKTWNRFADCTVLKHICCALVLRCSFIDIQFRNFIWHCWLLN